MFSTIEKSKVQAIEINHLSKYYGSSAGIKDVNFNVGVGEIFGFIGPNGAGKSTTIRTLLNLIFPTSGTAKVLGLDIVKDSRNIKKRIGYLPAENNFYSKMSVIDLLYYSAGFYGLKNFQKRADYLCDALDLDSTRKIIELSTGNKKKASIVQALLHQPELLILDEPTSGLDPLIQSAFYNILKEENQKGCTIFFSSHVLSEVQKICNRVAIIKDGKVIKVETIDNLKHNQLKQIRILFNDEIPNHFNPPGSIDSIVNTNSFSFMYKGNLNELLYYLSEFNITDLTIEDPSLEEIFLHFYDGAEGDKHE